MKTVCLHMSAEAAPCVWGFSSTKFESLAQVTLQAPISNVLGFGAPTWQAEWVCKAATCRSGACSRVASRG